MVRIYTAFCCIFLKNELDQPFDENYLHFQVTPPFNHFSMLENFRGACEILFSSLCLNSQTHMSETSAMPVSTLDLLH